MALSLDEDSHKAFRTELASLKRPKTINKRRIACILNKLKSHKNENKLIASFLKLEQDEIEALLSGIRDSDDKIMDLFEKFDIDNINSSLFESEIDDQTSYKISVNEQLSELNEFVESLATASSSSNSSETSLSGNILASINKVSDVRLPQLKCNSFKNNDDDKFAFSNFLNQFINVIDSRNDLSEAAKLTYLIGCLSGYALKVVSHLTVNNSNYSLALDLLKMEFLDVPFLKDETIKKLLNLTPSYDPTFNSTKMYLTEIRSIVFELKNFDIDFLDIDDSGCALLSCIIYSKLPNQVKRELVHKAGTNYPLLPDIFNNYNDIIKTLVKTGESRTDIVNSDLDKVETLQNFKTQIEMKSANTYVNRPCKLCDSFTHSMYKCDVYRDYNTRVQRCHELSLCAKCSSKKHDTDSCSSSLDFICYLCKQNNHISALCPKKLPVN